MNRTLSHISLPPLPRDEPPRSYNRDLQDKLRQQDHAVIAQLNSQVQSIGKTLSSAASIELSNPIHHVSGAAAIETITAPSGFTGPVWLIADGAWSVVTTGNVVVGLTAIVGRAYNLIFDGQLWYPVNVI